MMIELLVKTGFDEMETSVLCQLGTFRTGAVGSMMDGFSCAINAMIKKNCRKRGMDNVQRIMRL